MYHILRLTIFKSNQDISLTTAWFNLIWRELSTAKCTVMCLDPREYHKPEAVGWCNQQSPQRPFKLVIEAKHLVSLSREALMFLLEQQGLCILTSHWLLT